MNGRGIVAANDYVFNAASKTVTFSADYSGLALSDILYILNCKQGVATVVYDPTVSTKGGTLLGRTLTLQHDTTSMSSEDPLQIIIGTSPTQTEIANINAGLHKLLSILESPTSVVQGRQIVSLENIAANLTLTNLTTVNTVTNLTNFGQSSPDVSIVPQLINEVFNTAIRGRIA